MRIGLEAFAVSSARSLFPGQRITSSISRVSEELFRALLFDKTIEAELEIFGSHPLIMRDDEKADFCRRGAVYKQLPYLSLLPTGNKYTVLPVNATLQKYWYPRAAAAPQLDLFIYSSQYPWGKRPVAKRELWVCLDFHLFRSSPRTWRRYLDRLRNSRTSLWALCISNATGADARQFIDLDDDHIKVVYLGVDHTIFRPSLGNSSRPEISKAIPDGGFNLYVGAWYGRKNLVTLIKAMDLFNASRRIPLKLVIAGFQGTPSTRQEKEALDQLIRSSTTEIVITGPLTEFQLAEVYRRATMLVHPSLFEGFGLTLVEAMACGTPVVCGDHSSVREVTERAALQLADLQSPVALCRAMESVADSPDLAAELRGRGLERAARFTWDAFSRSAAEFVGHVLRS